MLIAKFLVKTKNGYKVFKKVYTDYDKTYLFLLKVKHSKTIWLIDYIVYNWFCNTKLSRLCDKIYIPIMDNDINELIK